MAISQVTAGTVEIVDAEEDDDQILETSGLGLAPGDVIVLAPNQGVNGSTIVSDPANSHQCITDSSPSSGSISSACFLVRVPSPVPATIAVKWSEPDDGSLVYSAWRGVDWDATLLANVLDSFTSGWAATATPTSSTIPSKTVPRDGCRLLGVCDMASGSEAVTAVGGTIIANGSERNGIMADFGTVNTGSSGTRTFNGWPASAYRVRSYGVLLVPEIVPDLLLTVVGEVTDTAVPVRIKSANATSARARIDGNLGSAGIPDGNGWCVSVVTGLDPNTAYDQLDIILDDTEEFLAVNSLPIVTNQTAGLPFGTREIVVGTCFNPTTISGTDIGPFGNIIARGTHRLWFLGDQNYADNPSTSQSSHLADYEESFAYSSTYREISASVPQTYMPGDHDFGGNNAFAGAWTAPTRAAALQIWAYQNRPNANGLYHSYVDGRMRVIFLDTRSFAVEDVTRLGSAQMAWLEEELAQPEPFKILTVDTTWIDNRPSSSGGDTWKDPAGSGERDTISEWIDQPHHVVLVVHGDQHCLAADDGSGNPWGNCPVVSSAPYKQNASHKTQNGAADWSQGAWPTSGTAGVEQYTKIIVTDTGTNTIGVQSRGYDTSDTLRVSLDFDVPVPVEATVVSGNAGSATAGGGSATVRTGATVTGGAGAATAGGGSATITGAQSVTVSGGAGAAVAAGTSVSISAGATIAGGAGVATAGGGSATIKIGDEPDPPEPTVSLSSSDLELRWLQANGATSTNLADARREVYGDEEHAYFGNLSGLVPVAESSLADHQLEYYRDQTGKTDGTVTDAEVEFWRGG